MKKMSLVPILLLSGCALFGGESFMIARDGLQSCPIGWSSKIGYIKTVENLTDLAEVPTEQYDRVLKGLPPLSFASNERISSFCWLQIGFPLDRDTTIYGTPVKLVTGSYLNHGTIRLGYIIDRQ